MTLDVRAAQRFPSGFAVDVMLACDLRGGSMLVLFGPSGAGKTTILRQIAGLERPDRGSIRFGDDVWFDSARGAWCPPQGRRLGVVFQQPTLFPHLSVLDNIRYGGVRHVSDTVMPLVADIAARPTKQLSGGEAQRVSLARALARGPQLLLLDEPFASVDTPTRSRLRRDLRSLLQQLETPAILVTHDRTEAMAMGDLVAVVIDGRIRQVGAVADVFSHPADAAVAASLGVESVLPARVTAASQGLLTVAIGAAALHVAEREPIAVGAHVYACIRAEDVTLETAQDAGHASVRNHLGGTIVSIASEGPIDRVTLDCGFALDALITRRSRDELQLVPGSRVTAAIKATSVHLVPLG